MKTTNELRFTELPMILSQIRILSKLLGQWDSHNELTKDNSFGLFMLLEQIADNLESFIQEQENKGG